MLVFMWISPPVRSTSCSRGATLGGHRQVLRKVKTGSYNLSGEPWDSLPRPPKATGERASFRTRHEVQTNPRNGPIDGPNKVRRSILKTTEVYVFPGACFMSIYCEYLCIYIYIIICTYNYIWLMVYQYMVTVCVWVFDISLTMPLPLAGFLVIFVGWSPAI